MRKTLSLILSVIMVLSVCSFVLPASAAPEGTAINTADEFMAMVSTPADATEPTAKYYLASDITLPGSYVEPFWGILDGNGKTVTVSAPMFEDFSGEVMNLTIKGEIFYQDANAAAFTTNSTKGFNATNVTNNANVTVTGNAKLAGGFVADCEKIDNPCVFVNCINNGNIYIDSTADQKMRAGGFGGIIDSCIFTNCENNGDVYTKGNICIAGGFVGRIALNVGVCTAEAYNCINTGDIIVDDSYLKADGSMGTGGSDAGGIFGYIGGKGNNGWYRIWGCVNEGKVDGPRQVGGMVGYVYAAKTTAYVDVQFCINKGDIVYGRIKNPTPESSVWDYGSPFVGYTNSEFTTVKYNIDVGTLTLREGAVTTNAFKIFIGCSSADSSQYDVQGNYVLDKEQYTYYSYASDPANAAQIRPIAEAEGIIVTTLADIKSGKVCYEIMQTALADSYGYAGSEPDDDMDAYAFYQTIGTDDFPGVDASRGWVVLNGTTYANGEKPADETTATEETTAAPEAGDETTAAPEAGDETTAAPEVTDAPTTDAPTTDKAEEKKGCGGFVAGSAIVAILGTALIVKKRD